MLIAALRSSFLRLPKIGLPRLGLPKMELKHWSASLMLAAVLVLNLIAGLSILGVGTRVNPAVAKVAADLPTALRNQVPPAPEPLKFREIRPEDAVSMNAAIPVSALPNPAARPFMLKVANEADRTRAIECLTSAIYYEAASEAIEGQRAVAQVVLNRLRHPAYPNTVCGVVFQGAERATGCQFTFTCDGALARTPHAGLWRQARQIAEAALAGAVYKPVGWATHYHTNWVVPYWSSSLVKAAIVGTHIFYRWTGGWGTGPAFRTRYAGVEPTMAKMKHLSTVQPSDEELQEALAAEAAASADGTPLPPQLAELLQRPVVRRYEAAKAEGVAAVVAEQAKASGTAVTPSYRWALTGDEAASKEAPLGKKAEAPKTPEATAAKPVPPKELGGVRKVAGAADRVSLP
jgi:spore germination cell wall hydrolase CwlJ-like protein